mgnify:CR=1 FL=1
MAPKPYIVVGRSRDCDLILDDPTVSGRHARMEWRGKNIVVQDLGSANGTFVDGEAIETKEIRPGADLRFGRQPFPWSAKTVRDFLRAGGTDTVLGDCVVPAAPTTSFVVSDEVVSAAEKLRSQCS